MKNEDNVQEQLKKLEINKIQYGIYLNDEKILDFINANCFGEFGRDKNGKLEIIKKAEGTPIDEEFAIQLSKNSNIYIAMSNEKFDFKEDEYIKIYVEENLRLVVLNQKYYNIQSGTKEIIDTHTSEIKTEISNLYSEELSDVLVKSLYNKKEISVKSSTATVGKMAQHQVVYHGPNTSYYATVGSVGYHESVYILSKAFGFYHIQYTVGSTGKQKQGYVPQLSMESYTGPDPQEEDYYGGYCYANQNLSVKTCDDPSLSYSSGEGSLFQYEGCTMIFHYNFSSTLHVAYIEYSTSTGAKRGYVDNSNLVFPHDTCVGVVNSSGATIYGGPNSNDYTSLGSVGASEFVGILAKRNNSDEIYVEYNTNAGRKRGYMNYSQLNAYNRPTSFPDLPSDSSSGYGSFIRAHETVYGGPSTQYASIGVVNYETIINFSTQVSPSRPLTYIEYWITGSSKKKSGYIDPTNIVSKANAMENNTLISLEDSYTYFGNKTSYGTTQLNKTMNYYKAGTGNKHLFLIFALHGWEDGESSAWSDGFYHGDGNILVRLAKNFIERFESSSFDSNTRNTILNKWTIYVFPGVNLDGIVNGYTNDGFGRCLYNDLDPNRNWGGSFIANNSNPREKTDSTYFQAQELTNLRDVLLDNIGLSDNVLIDIHGWQNMILSDNTDLKTIFYNAFTNVSSGFYKKTPVTDNGFLIKWAKNSPTLSSTATDYRGLGATTGLLELPPTQDYSVPNIEDNYGYYLFDALNDLLLNYFN